jgi:branched-chain amino acid transport system ATP-binding protein
VKSGTTGNLLDVRSLEAGYDKKPVLHGVSLSAKPGEIVAMVGPNGAGKSTILKAVFGLLRTTAGTVEFQGRQIQNRRPSDNVRDGISLVLQGSRVFTELTVIENLEMGGYTLPAREVGSRIEDIFALFPALKEMRARPASTLSTGEKQMLAMARGLMLKPVLLLLDEPSLGLAPRAVHDVLQSLRDLNQRLGTAILLVEQNVREALTVADRVYVLRLGRVALEESPDKLTMNRLRSAFLA